MENGRRVSCIDEVQAASSFFSAGQDIGKESGEAGDGADMSQGMEQENKETRTDIFPLLGKGVLIGIVDSGIDYEILISEMRMGQRELQHYGIRQWKPDCLLRAIM